MLRFGADSAESIRLQITLSQRFFSRYFGAGTRPIFPPSGGRAFLLSNSRAQLSRRVRKGCSSSSGNAIISSKCAGIREVQRWGERGGGGGGGVFVGQGFCQTDIWLLSPESSTPSIPRKHLLLHRMQALEEKGESAEMKALEGGARRFFEFCLHLRILGGRGRGGSGAKMRTQIEGEDEQMLRAIRASREGYPTTFFNGKKPRSHSAMKLEIMYNTFFFPMQKSIARFARVSLGSTERGAGGKVSTRP